MCFKIDFFFLVDSLIFHWPIYLLCNWAKMWLFLAKSWWIFAISSNPWCETVAASQLWSTIALLCLQVWGNQSRQKKKIQKKARSSVCVSLFWLCWNQSSVLAMSCSPVFALLWGVSSVRAVRAVMLISPADKQPPYTARGREEWCW